MALGVNQLQLGYSYDERLQPETGHVYVRVNLNEKSRDGTDHPGIFGSVFLIQPPCVCVCVCVLCVSVGGVGFSLSQKGRCQLDIFLSAA